LGILYSGLLGGFTYNGAGVYIGHFSPFVSFVAIGAEAGAVSLCAFDFENMIVFFYQIWKRVHVWFLWVVFMCP